MEDCDIARSIENGAIAMLIEVIAFRAASKPYERMGLLRKAITLLKSKNLPVYAVGISNKGRSVLKRHKFKYLNRNYSELQIFIGNNE